MCGIDMFDYIAEINPESLSVDGFDSCIIGLCEMYGRPPIIAYDKRMMIDKLVLGGMKYDEAEEFFDYNILGSYVGENTPVFITRLDET